jgi:hypothetical protein
VPTEGKHQHEQSLHHHAAISQFTKDAQCGSHVCRADIPAAEHRKKIGILRVKQAWISNLCTTNLAVEADNG